MGALRVFLEIILIILTLALIYTLVAPYKAELKAYIMSIGNPQLSQLLYIIGYVIYKLGYLSYTLITIIAKYAYKLIEYLMSQINTAQTIILVL
ncbi:hypothetical protein [Vulcanisaeta thermophila]|uniref:hypothetical protein n=1 Tax=Vulcanisaeta thermophila TaxID=867917 RepID=UPI000852AA0E|nr:hypothetical protein [Vulcanisaeta thermophila]